MMGYKINIIVFNILLLWNAFLCDGQEPVKMTFLGINQFNSENGRPLYQCHLSAPDESAVVESFRMVWTRDTNNENPDPPDAVWTDNTYAHWRVTLVKNNDNSFGVFGCRATSDGRMETEISGIFMRSNAHIVPNDDLFSKTVNVGDAGVSIVMRSTGSNKPISEYRWLKNNVMNNGLDGQDTWSISGPVEADDAGVYECHIDGERATARQGLMLLIVRACPANRWGPGNCNGFCEDCYNGGICDENNGQCICAPGFNGTNCETACGGNRYGDICEKQCSSTDQPGRCGGYIFCLPHPFGCRCNTGWKGLACNDACTAGTYGASCLQTCHCQSGTCDGYTGVCTGIPTGCNSGWTGNNCQECVAGMFGPDCLHTCHCISGECGQFSGVCTGSLGCSSGWTGSNCQDACATGEFGDDCQGTCHCQSGACDRSTGECTPSGCSSGWTGSNCQDGKYRSTHTNTY